MEEKAQEDENWTYLGTLLSKIEELSCPLVLNDNEFIVCTSSRDTDRFMGIWSYNISNSCWKHLLSYNKDIIKQIEPRLCCYDKNNNKLYIMMMERLFINANIICMNLSTYKYNIFDCSPIHNQHDWYDIC